MFTRSKIFRVGSFFVACLLLCISFVPLFSKPVKEAKADNVSVSYSFVGSDFFVPYGNNYLSENHVFSHPATDNVSFMNVRVSLRNNATITTQGSGVSIPNCPYVDFRASEIVGNRWRNLSSYYYQTIRGNLYEDVAVVPSYCLYAYNIVNGNTYNITDFSDVGPATIIRYTQFFSPYLYIYEISDVVGARVDSYIQYGFSADVVAVRYYGETAYPATYGSNNVQYKNHIVYVDADGYTADIVFTSYIYAGNGTDSNYISTNRSDLVFDDRTYYLSTSFSSDTSYQLGYAAGNQNKLDYADAQVEKAQTEWESNLQSRLDDAENRGFESGKIVGYQEGVGADYGFEPFLTSALSALDVDIFGIFSLGDMFALIVGVSLVFVVLKIFAGG